MPRRGIARSCASISSTLLDTTKELCKILVPIYIPAKRAREFLFPCVPASGGIFSSTYLLGKLLFLSIFIFLFLNFILFIFLYSRFSIFIFQSKDFFVCFLIFIFYIGYIYVYVCVYLSLSQSPSNYHLCNFNSDQSLHSKVFLLSLFPAPQT